MSMQNFEVGSERWVDITHINNPHSFYVRPVAKREVLDHLDDRGGVVKKLYPGLIVVFKSKLLKHYVRGRVLLAQLVGTHTFGDLFALDFGSFEKSIPLEDIYECPVDVAHIPPLAVHCQLADCKPLTTNWSDKAIDTFKFFVRDESAKMIVRGRTAEYCIVELFTSDDIATMLAYSGCSTLGFEDNVISRFRAVKLEKHYFKFKEYAIDESITVRVQTGDSLKSFFVAEPDIYKEFLSQRRDFTHYCRTKREMLIEEIEVNMAVGVHMIFFKWYERAVIKAIDNAQRIKVMLVDWGNIIEVPLSRLKPMSAAYFENPAAAIHCTAEESQIWDNGLHKFLYPGFMFKITIVKLGEQPHSPHTVKLSPITDNK